MLLPTLNQFVICLSMPQTTRLGQVVYKDNSSWDLMIGLQAGIR